MRMSQYDIRGQFLIPTPRFAMPDWISHLLDSICDPLLGVHIPKGRCLTVKTDENLMFYGRVEFRAVLYG